MKNKSRSILWIDNKLVLIKREKEGELPYYVFPGGSVEIGENDEEACIRELKEELGIEVSIEKIVFEITDHIKNIREVFYSCNLISGDLGSGLDKKFIEGTLESKGYSICLISKDELLGINLLPSSVRDKII